MCVNMAMLFYTFRFMHSGLTFVLLSDAMTTQSLFYARFFLRVERRAAAAAPRRGKARVRARSTEWISTSHFLSPSSLSLGDFGAQFNCSC